MSSWKENQKVYALVMQNRHTDYLAVDEVVRDDDICVDAARIYIEQKTMKFHQPTKSRLVAVCYAKWIANYFDKDFIEVLSDPEMLIDDPDFAPYTHAQEQYDRLINELPPINEWRKANGWVSRTQKYFWLECTDTGLAFATSCSDEEILDFLDNGDISSDELAKME